MEIHNTHNVSDSSSEPIYHNNNESSSSSSNKEYLIKNESENEWSKIIKNNSSKMLNNGLISERDINITNRSYEDKSKIQNKKKNKFKLKRKYKNKNFKYFNLKNAKKNQIGINYYYQGKYKILNNGIIVKNLNQFKNNDKNPIQINPSLSNKEKFTLVKKNCFLPKYQNSQKNSFHIIYIKRPTRSFITKICKYKKIKSKKIKEFKKLNHSSSTQTTSNIGQVCKLLPNSSRITPMPTIILPKKEISKSIIRNKNLINENSENKLATLSTNSVKKLSINSNTSLFYSKSINNMIKNNKLKKRPLSSITNDIPNNDITIQNKSHNLQKIRPISSMMNSQIEQNDKLQINKESVIYENKNFKKQFKELKNAFESYDDNDNNDNNKDYYNFNIYNNYNDILRENQNKVKRRIMKFNSGKNHSISYNNHYQKEILPLYNFECIDKFEDEKQNKQNKFCKHCKYQRHFGNENNCPICSTRKEQNHIREEKLDSKNYYFPFKDKYETNSSIHHHSFRKNNRILNNFQTERLYINNSNYLNLFKTKNDYKISILNPYYLNNMFNSPNNLRQKMINNKFNCKDINKCRSNIFKKYNEIQKYFE